MACRNINFVIGEFPLRLIKNNKYNRYARMYPSKMTVLKVTPHIFEHIQ